MESRLCSARVETYKKLTGRRVVGDREEWLKEGKFHREDGPAVIWRGLRVWYLNGKFLEIIPKHILENYMKANNLILAHLLTDPDPLVRESASKYEWKEDI
jgi:hypothetical protein